MTKAEFMHNLKGLSTQQVGRTRAEAWATHEQRNTIGADRARNIFDRVHVGPHGVADEDELKRRYNPRAKNWETQPSTHPTAYGRAYDNDTYRGSYRGWTHVTHILYVECWARHTRRVAWVHGHGHKTLRVKAPRGYEWSHDRYGLYLRRLSDGADYHPNYHDCARGPRHIAARLRAAADLRDDRGVSSRAVRRAEREGMRVCMMDSRRAGNCSSGTLSWCHRHSVPTRGHIRPSVLLLFDDQRVQRVLRHALDRHRAEMRRGYARLEDHA